MLYDIYYLMMTIFTINRLMVSYLLKLLCIVICFFLSNIVDLIFYGPFSFRSI